MVFATHHLEEADLYADRVVLMSGGAIVADGTSSEIKAMASRRTVGVTLPRPDTRALELLRGFDQVEVRGERVHIHTADSDLVARYLLIETDARDLDITTQSLEEAFLRLTMRATTVGVPPFRERQGATR